MLLTHLLMSQNDTDTNQSIAESVDTMLTLESRQRHQLVSQHI